MPYPENPQRPAGKRSKSSQSFSQSPGRSPARNDEKSREPGKASRPGPLAQKPSPGRPSSAKSQRSKPLASRRIEPEGAFAVISRRAADRLIGGHVWVYRSDIERIVAPEDESRLIQVLDSRGASLGTALYSASSQIALRLISPARVDEAGWRAMVLERLREAMLFRKGILGASGGTDACRLVFSEADFLPGLIADQYGDLVVLQLSTQGMDTTAVRSAFLEVAREVLAPRAIFERSDSRIRELEQMESPSGAALYLREGASASASTVFHLNGLNFLFDANSGQKTGSFLDQRENYAAAARHCYGKALDVCTYQGGFALHLAQRCREVTGVDASLAALEVAEQNLALNREQLGKAEVDWVEANAFDLLREWSDTGQKFDSIVLDPPAFAKSKKATEGALRGYKELNLRAMKMLRPGGVLVTCSCSHHVGIEEFTGVVAAAAGDARRQVRVVERRGAAADHPVLLTVPETEYLKCLICRVD